jgi:hypothetical protein
MRQRELDRLKEEERKKKELEEKDSEEAKKREQERLRKEEEERKRREEEARKLREYQRIKKEVDAQLFSLVDKYLIGYREEQLKYNSKKKKKKEKAFQEESKVNGTLTVQATNGYEMHDFRKKGYSHYFLTVQLDGTNANEDFQSNALDFWTDQNFKWSVEIPMLKTKLVKLGYEFVVKVYTSKTKKFDDAMMIGQFKVPWNR